MKRALVVFCVISLVGAGQALAQSPPAEPKPGPEHKKLEYFVGKWSLEGEMKPGPMGPGGKMTASENCEWFMGGFHVEIMGHDATGEMLDLGAGENDAATQAIATGRPIYAERTFYPANGTVLTFGTLMCPLATDGRKVDMLICAVAPHYRVNDLPVARVNRFARAALETVARR